VFIALVNKKTVLLSTVRRLIKRQRISGLLRLDFGNRPT